MKNIILISSLLCLLNSCLTTSKKTPSLYNKLGEKTNVYDAVIVPGLPFINGQWDSLMKARVLWSVHLYKNKITKNIIFSGSAVYSPFYEAKIMGLYAQKLGVEPSHIFYDTLAKHSTENVYYSYKLAQYYGFKSLALATDPFQSRMLKSYTKRRFASVITHIPVNFETVKNMKVANFEIDSNLAYKHGFESILESETFLTRLQGTMGTKLYHGPDKRLRKL